MKGFVKKQLNLKGVRDKDATCDDGKEEEAQNFLSAAGSCGADAMKALRKRGFEKVRSELSKGIRDKKAACKELDGDKLDTALAVSDDDLDKETFVKKSR